MKPFQGFFDSSEKLGKTITNYDIIGFIDKNTPN